MPRQIVRLVLAVLLLASLLGGRSLVANVADGAQHVDVDGRTPAHVHGLEESRGTRALVMEFVDGRTLADIIAATGGRGVPAIEAA